MLKMEGDPSGLKDLAIGTTTLLLQEGMGSTVVIIVRRISVMFLQETKPHFVDYM